jgi:uncharacterized protein (TIGR02147 family)
MEAISSILISSENYRDFLREAFESLKLSRRGCSFHRLAQKIGCKSKSYPRDVMIGRRSLTAEYSPKFADAFGLRGDSKKLFLKLVELERTEDPTQIRLEIQKIKQRLKNKTEQKIKPLQDLFQQSSWIDIYAAAGSPENGASLSEICQRTSFAANFVEEILPHMIQKGVLKQDPKTKHYLPLNLHYFFDDADKDQMFEKRYFEILERVKKQATVGMQSDEKLFLCSTFSIKSQQRSQFKMELRELFNKFVEDSESAEGDQLSHLLVGFF